MENKDFIIVTDSASNLTEDLVKEHNLVMLSNTLTIDGEDIACYQEGVDSEAIAKSVYDRMRLGAQTKTTLINGYSFTVAVEPYIRQGQNVLFVGLSSGVSGTYNAICKACEELSEKYPERTIRALDTLAAGLGEGLIVLEVARLRSEGKDINETYEIMSKKRETLKQIFTVDDLEFLMRGGRISRLTAAVGKILNIKPLLKGNESGKIVSYAKVKGRRRALNALAKEFAETAVNPQEQTIAVTHGDCLEDAEYLIQKLKETSEIKDIILRTYDICTGSYVGPGTVALFFWDGHKTSLLSLLAKKFGSNKEKEEIKE